MLFLSLEAKFEKFPWTSPTENNTTQCVTRYFSIGFFEHTLE